jgi:prophage DNA circulation protein
MSWLEKVKTELVIKAGDGVEYRPDWLNANKGKEFNVTEFDFPNVNGTLVYRTTPKGSRYNLELYFQGENHLDVASNFMLSANDRRAWTLTHPYYGRLLVQPTSISIDNSVSNISKITCPVIETITDIFPKGSQDALADIQNSALNTNDSFARSFAQITPTPTTINLLNLNVLRAYKNMLKATVDGMINNVVNAFNEAVSFIAEAATEPIEAMQKTQALLVMPASFALSAQQRFQVLTVQYNGQRNDLPNIVKKEEKKAYESNVAATLTAISLTAATPLENDFAYQIDALSAVDLLLDSFNQYVTDLDLLSTNNNNSPTSYIPDYESLKNLSQLVNFTASNLFNIALNGKQERSFLLEEDSNWCLLTHRLYGLTDENLDTLIRNNNAGLKEALEVQKGRQIKYYV